MSAHHLTDTCGPFPQETLPSLAVTGGMVTQVTCWVNFCGKGDGFRQHKHHEAVPTLSYASKCLKTVLNHTVRKPHDVLLGFLPALGSEWWVGSVVLQIHSGGRSQVRHNMVSPFPDVLLVLL